jgi:hypothetical protein
MLASNAIQMSAWVSGDVWRTEWIIWVVRQEGIWLGHTLAFLLAKIASALNRTTGVLYSPNL